MTKLEKVIKEFEAGIQDFSPADTSGERFKEVCEAALAMLKAQEPVIPKPIHASERWYACGNCDCSISKGDDTYCPRCGRKVKWDD